MNVSNAKERHPRHRWEQRLYSAMSVLLLPFIFAATLLATILGRTLSRGYTDDVKIKRNIFSETASAVQSSVWWSFSGR
ncbi:MAG: hypothetical protein AAGF33_02615 [Pseudomonadota bacterium]